MGSKQLEFTRAGFSQAYDVGKISYITRGDFFFNFPILDLRFIVCVSLFVFLG